MDQSSRRQSSAQTDTACDVIEFLPHTRLSSGTQTPQIAVARRRRGSYRRNCRLEHLNGAFFRQLVNAFLILLMLQGIFNRHFGENLRRERRQFIEDNLSALAQ